MALSDAVRKTLDNILIPLRAMAYGGMAVTAVCADIGWLGYSTNDGRGYFRASP